MIAVGRMLKRRFANIVTCLHQRITNATSESLNAKIQWVKYTARGFRNKQNFVHAIYFHCGGPQPRSIASKMPEEPKIETRPTPGANSLCTNRRIERNKGSRKPLPGSPGFASLPMPGWVAKTESWVMGQRRCPAGRFGLFSEAQHHGSTMAIVETLVSVGKTALITAFARMVRWSPHYRETVLGILRILRLKKLVLAGSIPRRLLLTQNEPRYATIFDTRPHMVNTRSDFELHILVCERDLLRSVWALKSFFLNSELNPNLLIHNDGTLCAESIDILKTHFPGCTMPTCNGLAEALAGYPMCRFYRQKHVLSRKLLDVLLSARADYLLLMDTDVLWFSESNQIQNCVKTRTPFYLPGTSDAYARNPKFMKKYCGLNAAWHVNSGMIGYRLADFLDLDFIELALDKLTNIPQELVSDSIGYPVPPSVKKGLNDPVESANWPVMEQTLYALLFGRCTNVVQLCVKPKDGNKAHPFVNRPITKETALQHYISDRKWNAQFPVGVEYLLRNEFRRRWELHVDTAQGRTKGEKELKA